MTGLFWNLALGYPNINNKKKIKMASQVSEAKECPNATSPPQELEVGDHRLPYLLG